MIASIKAISTMTTKFMESFPFLQKESPQSLTLDHWGVLSSEFTPLSILSSLRTKRFKYRENQVI
ncbi:MAG: hypothetical protein ACTSWE_10390, partial [Promethearchaeota archaeon]